MAVSLEPHARIPQPLDFSRKGKPMQVLCLGLSRTSTMSLYTALKILGYESYHMLECSLDAPNYSRENWLAAINAKYDSTGALREDYNPLLAADLDRMLWRYDAVTDIPCVLFSDDLLSAYPDAKVVLTTRPADKWYASVQRSFGEVLSWKRWRLMEIIDRSWAHDYFSLLRIPLKVWSRNNPQDPEALKRGFEEYNAHIRAVVPSQRLLDFTPEQGWEPLCKFLGKEIPNTPYPKVNEGDFAANLHYFVFWDRLRRVLAPWLITLGIGAYGLGVWYGR